MKLSTPTFYLYALALLVCFTSCKASKKASETKTDEGELSDVISLLEKNSFRPSWFKAKAQLQTKMGGKGFSFTSTVISKDEELLWLNGKKFGIEGARFLITPDSIFAINRLKKEYLSEQMNWVAEEFELPALLAEAIDLKHLQDIFIGNPILDVIPYTEIQQKESDIYLNGNKEDYNSELMVNASNMQTRFFTLSQGESFLSVKYSDYRPVNETHAMAHRRDLNIKRPGEEDILLSIIYDNVIINEEQSIKFNIPGSYSRM